MSDKTPNISEKVRELLDEKEVNLGTWGKTQAQTVRSPFVDQQRDSLVVLRDYLQGIVDGDQKMLVGLREQVSRLKFGGGS